MTDDELKEIGYGLLDVFRSPGKVQSWLVAWTDVPVDQVDRLCEVMDWPRFEGIAPTYSFA